MQNHFQFPSGTGLRYPRSGVVVGLLAEHLRLKGYLKDDWAGGSYKTAQRYFQGDTIKAEMEEEIQTVIVDALLLTAQQPAEPWPEAGVTLRAWALALVKQTLRRWDMLVAQANGRTFPIVEDRWLPFPLLRLWVLDLGLRYGALQVLRQRAPQPLALTPDLVRTAMDRLRGDHLTVAQLAESAGVSSNTMDAWRQGKSQPTNDHVVKLARVLATAARVKPQDAELQLRLALGGAALASELEERFEARMTKSIIRAFNRTAELVWKYLHNSKRAQRWRVDVTQVVELGADAPLGRELCQRLAGQCGTDVDAAADFIGLTLDWSGRITYWAKMVRPMGQGDIDVIKARYPEDLVSHLGEFKEINDLTLLQRCAFQDFAVDEEEEKELRRRLPFEITIPGERIDPIGTFSRKGERALSINRYEKAAEYFLKALGHAPDNEYLHYSLGCALGLLVSQKKRLDLVDEAVRACRTAAELAPNWGSPRTEIAIILSNAGRLEEAVDAFERALPFAQEWAHYHLTYGHTLLWLERFQDAVKCYEAAIRLKPAHLDAHLGLAASLHALGDLKGLQKRAKAIRDLGGPQVEDPSHWRRHVPPGPPNPVQRRADYPREVGPDEPCPCASGKKYRRCCGRTAAGATPPQR